ncbi:protein ENHANCED DOWNY MILDEW 2 [Citrus sinensis]|uniref:Protein ENHANCED DOWNY MILDEW 2 n=1 Tax=Citrus sinensis TaxID=2711 RepID=A0ACB8N6M0_CITSI|nr:protein ENHANCED DOWNY MILDEW 2 [Citrus sinensis]
MGYSEEDDDTLTLYVSDYEFLDQNEESISFSVLPLQWDGCDIVGSSEMEVFLHGNIGDGPWNFNEQVIAWKFELSYAQPEIWVLSKQNNWIMLQSPKKSFKNIVRTILITVHWLHCVKQNPEASRKYIREQMLKVFCSYEVEPSENDLLDHMPISREAAERDKDLANSKDVRTTEKPKVIVDWNEDEDSERVDKDENYFAVCAICDDGGDVTFCDGRCLRSFHATITAGKNALCQSLGYTQAQIDAVPNFLCQNCVYQEHQCFACGMLGSSDKSSSQEVFPCVSATCGQFYHPECVSKLLHPDNESLAEEHRERIAAGESFTCPVHKCFVCQQSEDMNVEDLQLAICRRCPKAYHRKCLPTEITFSDADENNFQRAWVDLLPNNRILIYCLEHKIISELKTPARDHLKFPGVEGKRKKEDLELLLTEEKDVASKRNIVSESFVADKTVVKKLKLAEVYSGADVGMSNSEIKKRWPRQDVHSLKKPNITDTGRKSLKDIADKSKPSLRKDSTLLKSRSFVVKPGHRNIDGSKMKNSISDRRRMKKVNISQPSVDAEMEKELLALIKDSTSSFNEEEFMKSHIVPITDAHHSKHLLEKSITLGLVEGSVKAVRAALEMLDGGCDIEDAKARKLDVYLAPFLHGMRYTSFGRHFTKVEKLKENDFSFEKRDWMTVRPEELPDGSQLIMGLNPPFGVKASLANKFISQALKFKPKLIVLIVPQETRRLDQKALYNLIWEDNEVLSGKSFYLPGSLDVHDNQLEQWNCKPPPLYLWSRADWTASHKKIALGRGHITVEE